MFAFTKELLKDHEEIVTDRAKPTYELLNKGEKHIATHVAEQGVTPDTIRVAMQEVRDVTEISAMLYPFAHLSWHTLREMVFGMPLEKKAAIVKEYLGVRSARRERPGRALESGYEYEFDLITDWGVYKDLMRHRMNSQQRQLFISRLGFSMPKEIVAAGFEKEIQACVDRAAALYEMIAKHDPVMAQYAVLHGNFVRWSISMSDKEAMHMLELRTTPQGHPAYRVAAQEMHKLIAERSRWRADMMQHVDYNDYYWSRADSEAKQRVQEQKLDEKYKS
jgi:hypothetical protein